MFTLLVFPRREDDAPALTDLCRSLRRGPAAGEVVVSGADSGPGLVVARLSAAADACGLLLSLVRTGLWAVVLVVQRGSGADVDRGEMPALCRRAVRASGRVHLALGSGHGHGWTSVDREDLAAAAGTLRLVARLEARRSEAQQQAGRLVDAGLSQREAAAELGVSQQAVLARLQHGLWEESRTALAGVLPLLDRLDRPAG